MKTLSSILLCTAFALAAAMPWYSNSHKSRASHQRSGYYDSKGYYHSAAEAAMTHKTFSAAKIQQKSGLDICESAKYGSGNVNTYVHVCETGVSDSDDKEYCFITNGDCCIIDSSSGSPVEEFKLTLDGLTVNVKYYGATGAKGACFDLDKHIDVCGGCPEPSCVGTVCLNNTETGTLSSCGSDGVCTCKPAFAPPDCCECNFDNGYFKDPDTGECTPFCDTCRRRTRDGCAECADGYAGHDCCDCDEDYYKAPDDTCRPPECPKNLVSCTNGQCTCNPGYLPPDCCDCDADYYKNANDECLPPECPKNLVSCTNGRCTCNPGYLPPDCCDCDADYYKNANDECLPPECPKNLVSCTNGRCTCNPGYLPPDCCDCDADYYKNANDECLPPECPKNLVSCTNGRCTCNPGYLPPDCCDCDADYYKNANGECLPPECPKNLVSCTNGRCTCNPGYLPPDCCDCADGYYYNPTTKTCDEPCPNTVECKDGKCTCKTGFLGDDCCEEETENCATEQDIFFVLDVTGSNSRDAFCETHYGTELLLAALKPGSGSTDTRVEMVLFPKTASVSENELQNLIIFPLGTGCEVAVGDGLTLIETFYNYREAPPLSTDYFRKIHARRTYPAPAIQAVGRSIESSSLERPRVVVILTDGITDEGSDDPQVVDEVNKLRAMESETITVIVGGYKLEDERERLEEIAGNKDDVVIESDSVALARGIVQRMAAAGAICPDQETELLKQLQNSDSVRPLCECIKSRRTRSNIPSQKLCCVPAGFTCEGETETIGRNPYYEPSTKEKDKTCPITNKNKKSELEQEILQAVEEVLQQRMNIN